MLNEIIIGTIRLPRWETIRMPFGLYSQNNTFSRYPYSVYLIFQREKAVIIKINAKDYQFVLLDCKRGLFVGYLIQT